MTGFSSWRFWFKSGLKGKGEAVDMFGNLPQMFLMSSPFSLPSETRKEEMNYSPHPFDKCFIFTLKVFKDRQHIVMTSFFNLDAHRSLGSRSVFTKYLVHILVWIVLWSLEMSKIQFIVDRIDYHMSFLLKTKKLEFQAVLVISCYVTNYSKT